MSPFLEPEPLRRWCEKCQQFTPSWTDTDVRNGHGTEKCLRCQKPPATRYKDPFYETSKGALKGTKL